METMEHQYLEGLPCFRINEEKRKCYFDTSGDNSKELEKFYEQYLDATAGGDAEHFAIGSEFAAGLEPFVNWLDKTDNPPICLKGQVTGPITAGLGLTDQDGKSIFYDDTFADIVVKGMALKGYWNAVLFRKYTDFILIFMDEPVLSGFGSSAFITVSRELVIEKMNEAIDLVHQAGALVGSHCCGNTDWSILAESKLDLISFDAFFYADTIALYPKEIRSFLERGGRLAWGIVPTLPVTEDMDIGHLLEELDVDKLMEKLEQGMKDLSAKDIPISLIQDNMVITPSCGTGSLSIDHAVKVYEFLAEIRERVN